MKKIVTHVNPDLDAIASVWLIKKFLPGWGEAEIGFCEPQSTIDDQPVDSNPEILHVDVGMGEFDHHQTGEYLSATQLCFDYLKKQRQSQPLGRLDQQALEEMVAVINEIDNARDLGWPETESFRYDFYLHVIIAGIRGLAGSDNEAMDFGLQGMEAIFHQVKKRLDAREEIKKGIVFETAWGKGIAVETGNDNVLWEGERQGYCLVIRQDSESGGVRIYSRPDANADLTKAYNRIRKVDPQSEWFLHASKRLLLNMSSSRAMKPTKLSLEELINILRKDK